MASKLPYLQFFVDDWLAEERLRICSLAARGLWIDLLSLMHKSARRGFLIQANGQPMTNEQIARICGCSTAEVAHLKQELLAAGVSAADEHGAIYNRRMVRDEKTRQLRSEAGKKGGNPILLKPEVKGEVKQEDKHSLDYGNGISSSEGLGDARGKGNPWQPPTVDEVRAYCRERGNTIDPEAFVDFYTSKGWMIGKNRMKKWQAAVRTWEKNANSGAFGYGSSNHGTSRPGVRPASRVGFQDGSIEAIRKKTIRIDGSAPETGTDSETPSEG